MSYLMELLFQINQCKACFDAINLYIEPLVQYQDPHSIQFINLDLLILLKPKMLSNNSISLFLQQFKPLMGTSLFKSLVKLSLPC